MHLDVTSLCLSFLVMLQCPSMSDPQNTPVDTVDDVDLYFCFRLMKEKNFEGAKIKIEEGIRKAQQNQNVVSEGLYLSAMGVLFKLKKDHKESYKYYQLAERLLPEDHSLKIISSTLLIHEFHQFDTAIRKLKKVLESANVDPVILHQAKALIAMAYFATAKKSLAKEILATMVIEDFSKLRSATHVNYKLPEYFILKNFELDACLAYLRKALALAKDKHEDNYIAVVNELIQQTEVLKSSCSKNS